MVFRNFYPIFQTTGDFKLSDKIANQIRRICDNIRLESISNVEKRMNDIRSSILKTTNELFINLPWYKRLFFKSFYNKNL